MKCIECQGGGQLVAAGAGCICAGGIDKKIDPDSDTARLAAHRKASSIWPNGRPETHDERRIRRGELRLRAAAALVSQALIDVDHIRDAKPVRYAPTYENEFRGSYERRPYTLKDAKPNAAHAARLLRQAWEILDSPQEATFDDYEAALGPFGK